MMFASFKAWLGRFFHRQERTVVDTAKAAVNDAAVSVASATVAK